jgi:hypothetical protein
MTKTFLLAGMATLALAACQAPTGGQQGEIKQLRADVDALNLEVFGNPLAKCGADKILSGPADYAASLVGLPDAELESEAWHTSNGLRKDVVTTASGLQYTIVQKGNTEGPSPVGSEVIKVNYHGTFPNGEKFDSSYDRGEPIEFPANGVIKGWVEAMGTMKPCEARTLYVPGKLAYGDKGRGSIPENATLIFNVQLLAVGSDKGHNH